MEPHEGLMYILVSIVCPKYLDLCAIIFSTRALNSWKTTEDLVFRLQEIDPIFPGVVINEGYEVLITPKRSSRQRATNI